MPMMFVSGIFMTPDGSLWYAAEAFARLAGERWELLWQGALGESFPGGLRAVNSVGPPWILVSEWGGGLLRLSYEPGFKKVNVEPLADHNDGVSDAIMLDTRRALVATKDGFKVIDVDGGTLSPWPGPAAEGDRLHFARDARGRIWIAGKGLSLLEKNEMQMHSLTSLGIVTSHVAAIAADPAHEDGVVLVTSGNDLVFAQAAEAVSPVRASGTR
jgi:hypothetical protein